MFSFKSFIVSGLLFRFLLHFELAFIYMCEAKVQTSHVGIPLLWRDLLKRLFFSPLNGLGTFIKNQLAIDAWAYFSILNAHTPLFL